MKRLFLSFLVAVFWASTLWAARLEVMPPIIKVTLAPGEQKQATIYIVDADGESDNFTWQLVPDRAWLNPDTVSGQGPAIVTLTITSDNPSETVGSITVTSNIGESFVTVRRNVEEGGGKEFSFFLQPSYVEVEVTRTPGTAANVYPFSISIICSGDTQGVTCTASSDQSWLTLGAQGALACNHSFTATVNPNLVPEEGLYRGHIMVHCGNFSQQVEVALYIEDIIENQLIVSPTSFDLRVAKAALLPHAFTVTLKNANPEGRYFSWRAESESPWLRVEPTSGTASSENGTLVTVIVDPSGLPAGSYVGTVRFFSDLDENSATEGIPVTVNLTIMPWQTFEVFPGSLFWSFEKGETGLNGNAFPQRLHVYASPGGWSISTDVPWLTLSSLWPGEGEAPEGYFEVTPVLDFLNNLPCGRYEGTIKITDLEGKILRAVPVVVEIRPEGAPVTLPVASPRFSQLSPDFVRVEAVETNRLTLRLPAAAPPENEEECVALNGTWEEGLCHYHDRVYFVMRSPALWPGRAFAWRPTEGRFVPIEERGVPVPQADDLYVTLGPVGEITFGPVQLLGLSGEVFFEVKVGKSYASARTLQRIALQVYTPEGAWVVTDYYQGTPYIHPDVLVFRRAGGAWSACWEISGACTAQVMVTPGDGETFFYKLEFAAGGYWFEYVIERLTSLEMGGRWRFFDGDDWSPWEPFKGERPVFPPAF